MALLQLGIAAKAAMFQEQVLQSTQAVDMRLGNFMVWRAFVTFLLIKGALVMAMPVQEQAVQVFFMHLILIGYSGS